MIYVKIKASIKLSPKCYITVDTSPQTEAMTPMVSQFGLRPKLQVYNKIPLMLTKLK
jgi:hypothetical protein